MLANYFNVEEVNWTIRGSK